MTPQAFSTDLGRNADEGRWELHRNQIVMLKGDHAKGGRLGLSTAAPANLSARSHDDATCVMSGSSAGMMAMPVLVLRDDQSRDV